VVIDKLDLYI